MESEAVSVERIICRECHAALDASDRFCRYCGAPTDMGAGQNAAAAEILDASGAAEQQSSARGSQQAPQRAAKPASAPPGRWMIIGLLMIGIGPLALPYLWRSPHFTRGGKAVWTVSTIVITVAAAWAIWYLTGKLIADFRTLYFELTH